MKEKISFRLVAYTDAAGKFSPEAFRSGNEDNFYVDDDLTDTITNKVSQDEIVQLGRLGMLMVVADGMGGMNAGEVASQIAVDTVKNAFKTEALSPSIVETSQSRQKYLEQIIKAADKNIKSEARKDKSREGMGSTIIMAWLLEDELVVSWCGDSRAYIFNEKSGIRLISQDHSYVQELVNKGLLTYDQTFDHPQNNIITRSLGDPTKDAKPESKIVKVGKGDIILLCSDGLSGVLRDRKTYDENSRLCLEENMEDIIRTHANSMKECRQALWSAAERGGWYDNVTAILCQITDGPASPWTISPQVRDIVPEKKKRKRISQLCILIVFILALVGSFILGKTSNGNVDKECIEGDSTVVCIEDSLKIETSEKTIATNTDTVTTNQAGALIKNIVEQEKKNPKDATSDKTDGLTKIIKESNSDALSELTPIQKESQKENLKNNLTPTAPKKEEITEKPYNN